MIIVLVMAPLSMILNRETKRCMFGNAGKLVNPLLFMDDLKLHASSQRELHSFVRTVESFSIDIGMEFGLDKFKALVVRNGKHVRSDGDELPSGEVMKDVGLDEGRPKADECEDKESADLMWSFPQEGQCWMTAPEEEERRQGFDQCGVLCASGGGRPEHLCS